MRAILDVVLVALDLYKLVDRRRRGPVLADRLQRRQYPQRCRPLHLEPAPRPDRAAPPPDPQLAAQHRRHRHFADHPVAESCWSSGSSSITSILTCSERRMTAPAAKTAAGRFFEDFRVGETFRHATPRTLTNGDARSIRRCSARASRRRPPILSRARSAIRAARSTICSRSMSSSARRSPTFRSTRSPISAMPTAGFSKPVYPGDTLSATSEVIGLKENSNRQSGVVYVRTRGFNQRGETVIDYVRWVMVRKRDRRRGRARALVPELPAAVAVAELGAACPESTARLRCRARRLAAPLGDYRRRRKDRPRRRRDGRGGRASDRDAAVPEHRQGAFQPVQRGAGPVRAAADLWRPCHLAGARAELQRPRQRLPYRRDQRRPACRAAVCRRHRVRLERILETAALPGRDDVGALRVRTVATKNRPCADFPLREGEGYEPNVVLDLDYWVLAPRWT